MNRKSLIGIFVLLILIIGLFIGIKLIREKQISKSRAAVDPIVFKGDNVVRRNDGKWVAKKPQILLEITSPLGPPANSSPAPSGGAQGCPNKLIFGFNGTVTDKIKQLFTNPSVRFLPVGWGGIQPEANSSYDFSSVDAEINKAVADGQTPSIKFCDGDCFPNWAREMDQEVDRSYCCTTDYVCRVLKEDSSTVEAFKKVVSAMVNRYKSKVKAWDYGIEPNCRGYNPTRYTMWLKNFYEAVKSADPSAIVVGGHLSGANTDYLSGMYANGAKAYYDRLAVDPYGSPLDYSGLESIRDMMVSQNDDKKIWFGEWGVATNNDEANQAALIKNALDYMVSKPWIEAAFYHNFECELWTSSCTPGSDGYLGFALQRSDGSTKPAYDVFKNAVSACQ